MRKIKEATGCSVTALSLSQVEIFRTKTFGAGPDKSAVENTKAINAAIAAAHEAGGGTVEIEEGDYHVYTIHLLSNVNLHLMKGAILHAARTDIKNSYEKQVGEGGNYEEPEVNIYAGLQDHGHTYFANSLIYGADIENVMIYGEGLIDGSYLDEDGYLKYVLQGGDPFGSKYRNQKGHEGEWFGNKGIALVRVKNVVLKGFNLVIGGHFAIIAEGVENMLIEGVLVDTTRDALDVDCCVDVTVRNSVFNSLTDDALVMKSSYGAGKFMPTKNVLIEDCKVSGYDAGSVYAKVYTRDKLIATDRCGPTGRVKLGTEATCGYEQVTVRRVKFDRSRGFALEAVDGSDLQNIIFTDCEMDNVSSSPIFIRAGERGRFPVTGNSTEQLVVAGEGNVRLDNKEWVLPNLEEYTKYPALRYTPSYIRDKKISIDGHSFFTIVDPKNPARINEANIAKVDGKCYARKYDAEKGEYVPDLNIPIEEKDLVKYANASGAAHMARVGNIEISNVKITNADPRYPMLLMGLMDSKLQNIVIRNIQVEYRGGMKREHAVEQRQLNTNWEYTQFETAKSVQTLPWLINTFFLKNEGLLPRLDWDPERKFWKEDPYNVPEMPGVYPEPSNWGILPAYGMYARHVEGLTLENVKVSFLVEDERHPFVFDDVTDLTMKDIQADRAENIADVGFVTNHYKRPTNMEYVLEEPYQTTAVTGEQIEEKLCVEHIEVNAPAPGTPQDSLYPYPTVPCPETGYAYPVKTEDYPLPLTVHRPFFKAPEVVKCKAGETMCFTVSVRNPALEVLEENPDSHIYNEVVAVKDYTVGAAKLSASLNAYQLPQGASFDEKTGEFTWTPTEEQKGICLVNFVYDDNVIPERHDVTLEVL